MSTPGLDGAARETAQNEAFPEFAASDCRSIVFNVEAGDTNMVPSDIIPAWHWQGVYFEIDSHSGQPLDDKWKNSITAIADPKGLERVRRFCTENKHDTSVFERRRLRGKQPRVDFHAVEVRIFYSPGKAKRWGPGLTGPAGEARRCTKSENLLLRRAAATLRPQTQWTIVELPWDDAEPERRRPLSTALLRRLTYPHATLRRGAPAPAAPVAESECSSAWLCGSTLIRREEDVDPKEACHFLDALPALASPVFYVPRAKRADFMADLRRTPTCVVSGATLNRGDQFASPLCTEICKGVGQELGKVMLAAGVRRSASASMRAYEGTMSADADFTEGFCSVPGCTATHFKGTNAVWLHGNGWRIRHGLSYVLEEEIDDFSNHAKEACLMACATNERSFAVLANGGPTVAINLARFLFLCPRGRVVTLGAMHGPGGSSGASGAFARTAEQMGQDIASLCNLSPETFKPLVDLPSEQIIARLAQKPLTLICLGEDVNETFTLRPDEPNKQKQAGLTDLQALPAYCLKCATTARMA